MQVRESRESWEKRRRSSRLSSNSLLAKKRSTERSEKTVSLESESQKRRRRSFRLCREGKNNHHVCSPFLFFSPSTGPHLLRLRPRRHLPPLCRLRPHQKHRRGGRDAGRRGQDDLWAALLAADAHSGPGPDHVSLFQGGRISDVVVILGGSE